MVRFYFETGPVSVVRDGRNYFRFELPDKRIWGSQITAAGNEVSDFQLARDARLFLSDLMGERMKADERVPPDLFSRPGLVGGFVIRTETSPPSLAKVLHLEKVVVSIRYEFLRNDGFETVYLDVFPENAGRVRCGRPDVGERKKAGTHITRRFGTGDVVDAVAESNPGWKFDHWDLGGYLGAAGLLPGENVDSKPSHSFTCSRGPVLLRAVFQTQPAP